jgi:hypothetical protein
MVGEAAPSHIRLSNDYISVELDTEKPYEYYEEHSGKYPPGQIKKGEENLSQKCGDLRCSEIIFIDSKIE